MDSDDTDIFGVTVDGMPARRTGNMFSITAACGRDSVNVFVATEDPLARVEIGGVAQNPQRISLPIYGENLVNIKVTAQNGDVADDTLVIEKLIPFEKVTRVRWENTISVINNPNNNGGFTFISYEWFRNNETTPFSTRQWWSAGVGGEQLNTSDLFYVILRTSGDCCGSEVPRTIRTCPSNIVLNGSNVILYPNPAIAGQTLYVETDMDEELLKDVVVEVYSPAGLRITQLKLQGRLTPININLPAGIYVIVLTDNKELRREMKIVVR
jgi:hypothetical protein